MQALNIDRLFKFYVIVCLMFITTVLFLGLQKRYINLSMQDINIRNEKPSRSFIILPSASSLPEASINKKHQLDVEGNNGRLVQQERLDELSIESNQSEKQALDDSIESSHYDNSILESESLSTNLTSMQPIIPPLICSDFAMHAPTSLRPFKSQEELCEMDYGCGMLYTWKAQQMSMCEKPNELHLRNYQNYSSQLTCYKHNNLHLPPATFPHTVCEGENVVFDFSKLVPAPCLLHRPGYFCKKPTYYNYEMGALKGNCHRNERFNSVDDFSRDFGKDVFSSFTTFEKEKKSENLNSITYIDGVTIFVSREQDEHVNMFHSMTDFFATYVMIEMFQLNSSDVQIVLLDEHYDGPFDFLWNSVFSLKRPMMRASQFNNSTVRFERAIFQHSGYATHFLSHIMDFDRQDTRMCHSKIPLITAFSNRVIQSLGIPKRTVKRGTMIKGLFISRRPYVKNGVNHKFMGRQISNEDEVLENFRLHPMHNNVFTIEKIDFANLTLLEQIQKVHSSDFLIGYHGAGLTHSLWLPEETSGVLEIWKSAFTKSWRCFEQLTLWKGNYYDLWTNREGWNMRFDEFGDYLNVTPYTIMGQFSQMISDLNMKRMNLP